MFRLTLSSSGCTQLYIDRKCANYTHNHGVALTNLPYLAVRLKKGSILYLCLPPLTPESYRALAPYRKKRPNHVTAVV
jgi:hypothetical protein